MSQVVTQDHLSWARAIARRRAAGNEGLYQDLESAAVFGLYQAASRWRPDGGASFRTYAATRMYGAMADEMRARDHLQRDRRRRVHDGLEDDPGPPSTLERALELVEPSDPLEDLARTDAIRQAIHALPARERFVMWLRFDDEATLREIGELLGVTESRVSQIATSAIERLRKQLAPVFAT